MDGNRSKAALARIESALARIDQVRLTASAPRPDSPSAPHPAELALAALQGEVDRAVQEIDGLISQAGGDRG